AGSGPAAGIEFSMLGLDLAVAEGTVAVGWDGGLFEVSLNGQKLEWPGGARLGPGDRLSISAGTGGNYGYLRFGGELDVPMVMGSRATSLRARIGGLDGRALLAGDRLRVIGDGEAPAAVGAREQTDAPIRFVWGLHAEVFEAELREKFVTGAFRISSMMDRMGVRLRDEAKVFAEARILSLVSDPVVVGDIQILGDGTPIVLGRDHQPTGGYPRIGTIISADLDRFFQLRPNAELVFAPVGTDHAQALLRSGRA
ncbi:MAG TPA: biotin-dependent carboxyltransferase family protein, partial [Devosia sp.]|nr:biotin-dependent carboxyltransferase family protein [Devosia sp.]